MIEVWECDDVPSIRRGVWKRRDGSAAENTVN